MNSSTLSEAHERLLAQYRFDASAFDGLQKELAQGAFGLERNRVEGAITPLQPADLTGLAPAGSDEGKRIAELGHRAIAKGEVAVAILNGGMATRFGGVVKGVVPVIDGHTFLALKFRDVMRQPGRVPVFLLNSFATNKDTAAHLADKNHFGVPKEQVHFVEQSISMRLNPDGTLFIGADGAPSFFAPGHGDLLSALRLSPAYDEFVAKGGKYVVVSNVDNLAATLSPAIVGAHIDAKRKLTVEVAPREPNDAGGAPVRRGGKIEILEGFRFPPEFDQRTLTVFNTNTFVFGVEAIAGHYPLTWFRADKEVQGHKVVQFERLLGEVTSFVDATYLQVPRSGPTGRFLPVKSPSDLPAIVPWVQHQLLGGA